MENFNLPPDYRREKRTRCQPGFAIPLFCLLLFSTSFLFSQASTLEQQNVIVGAERLEVLLPMLGQKKVGLVVNHSSLVGDIHLADTLYRRGVNLVNIFAPEHGFRGEADAGELIRDDEDLRTGACIISLYGKKKKPSAEDLAGIDVVVFDIQDVGARFYTYISTLFYVLEACAEQDKEVIVLDRPNPNGHYVDGPVLDMRFSSFVGIAPLPIVHGCTIAELAQLFKGEFWIYEAEQLRLRIIPCENYTHRTPYDLPVKPSPNLPTMRSVLLYPSICLFEGTTASVGRGTEWPFEVVGHPNFDCDTFWFMPQPNAGNRSPLYNGEICFGMDFRNIPVDSLRHAKQLNLSWLLRFYRDFTNRAAFFREDRYLDLLAGTSALRYQIMDGKKESAIRASWAWDLEIYREIRKKYLLYPE